MTHLAWVPEEWEDAAEETLAGLAERHPSRTILLFPRPDDDDALEHGRARSSASPFGDQSVCAEVIRVRLCGERARHPASVVCRCSIPTCRSSCAGAGCRGSTTCSTSSSDVVDRLIVDSTEWPSDSFVSSAMRSSRSGSTAPSISDIAWERTERWRRELALAWPFEAREISVTATRAQALLLAGWLRSRLGHDVEVEHEPADSLTLRVRRRQGDRRASGRAAAFLRTSLGPARAVHARPGLRSGRCAAGD